jgi:hypothetical protein
MELILHGLSVIKLVNEQVALPLIFLESTATQPDQDVQYAAVLLTYLIGTHYVGL